MDFIAETIADLSPSLTLSITSQAKQMREDGIDVCGLAAGEPDFDTPQHIKNAAIDALQDGERMKLWLIVVPSIPASMR